MIMHKKRSPLVDDALPNWLAPENAPAVALRRYGSKGGGGGFVSIVAPILGAIAGGGLLGPAIAEGLGVSSALGIGAGAGLGGAAGSLVSGASPSQALKTGAISGLGAGIMSSLGAAVPAGGEAAAGGAGASAAGASGAGLPFDPTSALAGEMPSIAAELGAVDTASVIGSGAGAIESAPLAAPSMIEAGATPAIVGAGEGAISSVPLAGNVAPASPVANPASTLADLGGSVPGQIDFQGTGGIPASPAAEMSSALDPAVISTLQQLGVNVGGDATGGASMLDRLVSGAKDQIAKNPLGIGIAGAGLANNLIAGNESEDMTRLRSLAEQNAARGDQLASYLTSGTLPPGAQASLDEATNAAIAAIRSRHASSGTSGSTMELQEINAVKQRAAAEGAKIATSLLQSGIQSSGLSSNIYNALLNINARENEATGEAIGDFAAAMAGGAPVRLR